MGKKGKVAKQAQHFFLKEARCPPPKSVNPPPPLLRSLFIFHLSRPEMKQVVFKQAGARAHTHIHTPLSLSQKHTHTHTHTHTQTLHTYPPLYNIYIYTYIHTYI
jgi:hypothetical protein